MTDLYKENLYDIPVCNTIKYTRVFSNVSANNKSKLFCKPMRFFLNKIVFFEIESKILQWNLNHFCLFLSERNKQKDKTWEIFYELYLNRYPLFFSLHVSTKIFMINVWLSSISFSTMCGYGVVPQSFHWNFVFYFLILFFCSSESKCSNDIVNLKNLEYVMNKLHLPWMHILLLFVIMISILI